MVPDTSPPPGASPAATNRAQRRRTLLDAGIGPLLADRPWAEIRMVDVAAAAGVSRQTLYDEFGSRQGLAQAYVASETDRFLGMVDDALLRLGHDPQAAVAAAMETFLAAARAGGLLRAVVAHDGNQELLALITTHGEDVLDASTARLVAFFTSRWPGSDVDDATLVARNLVRLALSHATRPDGEPGPTAAAVAALFGPFLDRMVSRAAGDT